MHKMLNNQKKDPLLLLDSHIEKTKWHGDRPQNIKSRTGPQEKAGLRPRTPQTRAVQPLRPEAPGAGTRQQQQQLLRTVSGLQARVRGQGFHVALQTQNWDRRPLDWAPPGTRGASLSSDGALGQGMWVEASGETGQVNDDLFMFLTPWCTEIQIPKQKNSLALTKLPSYGKCTNSNSATVMLHASVQCLLFQSAEPREINIKGFKNSIPICKALLR